MQNQSTGSPGYRSGRNRAVSARNIRNGCQQRKTCENARAQLYTETLLHSLRPVNDQNIAGFADLVDRLPFAANSTIIAVGDSVTDDDQSWLEILRHLISIRRPDDQIRIINAGVSGDTTTHAISRCSELTQLRPDWILFMIGLNDARKHGIKPDKTLVSLEETGKNLHELRRFAVTQTTAELVWMTPPAVIEQKISEYWLFKTLQTCWANDDISAVAELIRQLPDRIIDVHSVFGLPPNSGLLLDDGLHPSLQGQKAIVTALVERLAHSSRQA